MGLATQNLELLGSLVLKWVKMGMELEPAETPHLACSEAFEQEQPWPPQFLPVVELGVQKLQYRCLPLQR
jgi:hypothetical protein